MILSFSTTSLPTCLGVLGGHRRVRVGEGCLVVVAALEATRFVPAKRYVEELDGGLAVREDAAAGFFSVFSFVVGELDLGNRQSAAPRIYCATSSGGSLSGLSSLVVGELGLGNRQSAATRIYCATLHTVGQWRVDVLPR